MTAEDILATVKEELTKRMDECDRYLEKFTDTGTMWRSAAFEDVLKLIKSLEGSDGLHTSTNLL